MRVGRSIHAAFPGKSRHPLRALDQRAMELASQDAELRAALFRFVDVTPACRSLDDLARHLTGYLEEVDERPPPIEAAMRMSGTKPGRAALGAAAAAGVRHMAHRIIVGETPKAALRAIRHLWENGAAVSLDLLGEATVTEAEADRYAARCLDALETLAGAAPSWPARPVLEADSLGPLPRVNLSVKVSALTPLLRPEAPEIGREDAAGRMRPLLVRANELGAHLHIDMESVDTIEATLGLVFELLDEPELRAGPSAGIVIQAYLRESPEQLERVLEWASATEREPPLVVRLVKGAYWDHEVVDARQHGWTPPVFEDKRESDRNFEALTRRLLEAWPRVRPAIASHNLRSVAHALAATRELGREDRDVEFQVLRGLGDDLAAALADVGQRVRIYCPVGDMVAGMAYLVRRLLENTSNESFLGEQQRGTPIEALLPAPCASATSRSWSCAARRCASRCWRRCAGSTRSCRSRSRFWWGPTAAPHRVSTRPIRARPTGWWQGPAARPRLTPPQRSRPPSAASGSGARSRRPSAPRCCAGPPLSFVSAASSWPRFRSASAPSRGPRPTVTCARRLTFSSTTRSRRSTWRRAASSCRCRASATQCATPRAAWRP